MKKLLLVCCLFIGFTAAAVAQKHEAVADPAAKAKGLQKELALNDHQTEKIAAIYKESAHKFDEIKTKEHGDTNKMLKDIAPLRTSTIKQIKAVLTAHQAAKYDKLLKQGGTSSVNGGWSDGWS